MMHSIYIPLLGGVMIHSIDIPLLGGIMIHSIDTLSLLGGKVLNLFGGIFVHPFLSDIVLWIVLYLLVVSVIPTGGHCCTYQWTMLYIPVLSVVMTEYSSEHWSFHV